MSADTNTSRNGAPFFIRNEFSDAPSDRFDLAPVFCQIPRLVNPVPWRTACSAAPPATVTCAGKNGFTEKERYKHSRICK